MVWLLALAASLAAPPPADELARRIKESSAALSAHGQHALTLGDKDLAEIAAGRVVRRRQRVEGADQAIGAIWSDSPIDALWLSILDDAHFKLVKGLFEEQLPGTAKGRKFLYQHVDMPWPIKNRQWVLDIDNNPALFAATGGKVWERTWTLADSALAPSPREDAIWVSLNEGGWQIYSWPDGVLLIYHVRASMDGWISDDLVTRYAMSTLEKMLRDIDTRAGTMASHYDKKHARLTRPDGSEIPAMTP